MTAEVLVWNSFAALEKESQSKLQIGPVSEG